MEYDRKLTFTGSNRFFNLWGQTLILMSTVSFSSQIFVLLIFHGYSFKFSVLLRKLTQTVSIFGLSPNFHFYSFKFCSKLKNFSVLFKQFTFSCLQFQILVFLLTFSVLSIRSFYKVDFGHLDSVNSVFLNYLASFYKHRIPHSNFR